MKKLNNFLNFEIKGIEKINGGIMAYGTCKLTNCNPCPDQECADCCTDEESDV